MTDPQEEREFIDLINERVKRQKAFDVVSEELERTRSKYIDRIDIIREEMTEVTKHLIEQLEQYDKDIILLDDRLKYSWLGDKTHLVEDYRLQRRDMRYVDIPNIKLFMDEVKNMDSVHLLVKDFDKKRVLSLIDTGLVTNAKLKIVPKISCKKVGEKDEEE